MRLFFQDKDPTFDVESNSLNQNEDKTEKFITSPVDNEVHCNVDLRDAIVEDESNQQFKELSTQYQDVF